MAPVTIIIPARNEACGCPSSSGNSRTGSPEAQVVVVDDHSTDGTGEVAARARARVVGPLTFPRGGRGRRGPATRRRSPPRRETSCSWMATSSCAPKRLRGPRCAGNGAGRWSPRKDNGDSRLDYLRLRRVPLGGRIVALARHRPHRHVRRADGRAFPPDGFLCARARWVAADFSPSPQEATCGIRRTPSRPQHRRSGSGDRAARSHGRSPRPRQAA